jgi:RecB family exonuclease
MNTSRDLFADPDPSRTFQIIESSSAAGRLDAAAAFLVGLPPDRPVTIVAATRGAADDLARRVAVDRGATFGVSRFSLTQLAARVAASRLAAHGMAPSTALGTEAIAARAAFDALQEQSLGYLGGVAATPGFPRALARTLGDLRLASVGADAVEGVENVGPDLASLLRREEREFDEANTADRTRLLAEAAQAIAGEAFLHAPLVLLDVPIDSPVEDRLVSALIRHATHVLATVPSHDAPAAAALVRAGGTVDRVEDAGSDDLSLLRTHLFADTAPPERLLDGSLQFFSAPGEGRECVEIARRILLEARRGVPFDDMAILVRAPRHYHGLLEHALTRAHIPAWFDRGTRRPHPAGRAFLALLACAAEGLSARRFAEYLSLGQLPSAQQDPPPWTPSTDEALGTGAAIAMADEVSEDDARDDSHGQEGATLGGTLRAPRRWERLLVEAAVIGGDPDRWRRRLDGLRADFDARLDELRRTEADSPRIAGIERDRTHLEHLREFVLPLVDEMAAWPRASLWGEWLDRLTTLAPRILRVSSYVVQVLADLRPMAAVGPVALDEVRSVLSERLRSVEADPPGRRYGRVFVGSPAQVRGRAFRVAFVPGLAERMFPQKPLQDPLLGDQLRMRLDSRLGTRPEQGRRERVLLHLAAGAATERLYVSYPRIDVGEGRVRVPSFYALDLVRGATGRIPDHEGLARAASAAGDPSLAWPAPADPATAIDDQEHDLAVLRILLDASDAASVRGHAQYLLRLNAALRRSVTERWARGERRWSQFDGIVRVTDITRDALSAQRLRNRAYSLSALQKFATCPYQFFLSAVHRLHPAEDMAPLQRLDPLTKGTIVHRMQAVTFRELKARGELPLTRERLESGLAVLDEAVARVAADFKESLSPAIDRVWAEEIAVIARDLRGWLRRIADEGAEWTPGYFELAFGLQYDAERDPASVPREVTLGDGFRLRGAVDLVEERRADGTLRVTDHKTGKDRHRDSLVIDGGTVLQPVLYSMAVEQVLGRPVTESRLFFCTSAGGYKVRTVPVTEQNRIMAMEALTIVDRAIELGTLPAAPKEGACTWCDFRPVCGPSEEQRVPRKPIDPLRDLIELRSRP